MGLYAAFSIDVETGIVELTDELRAIWGFPETQARISLDALLTHVHPEDLEAVRHVRRCGAEKRRAYQVEYRIQRPDRQIRVHAIGDFHEEGGRLRNFGTLTEIEDASAGEARGRAVLTHDKLTNLYDRNQFCEMVQRLVLHDGEPFAVVSFDLDGFSRVNDTLGSLSGDQVLRNVASRLSANGTKVLHAARCGGDEFAFVVKGAEEQVMATAREVLARVLTPIQLASERIFVGASTGIALFPDDARDITLLEKAHLAQLRAKRGKCAGAVRFEPEMESTVAQDHRLFMDLRTALRRSQLEVFYQPIVSAKNFETKSAEALLRWNHPMFGRLSPDRFLSTALEARVMPEIDAWVMLNACVDTVSCDGAGAKIGVNVNVTADELLEPSFLKTVGWALGRSALRPERLTIEVTEQVLIMDERIAFTKLTALREMGVRVALDDFGVQFNSLLHLKRFPISEIKIDRAFVADLETCPVSRALCRGLTSIALELGIDVTAEGVETGYQERFLVDAGCSSLQGYRYARPMPSGAFTAHVSARRSCA